MKSTKGREYKYEMPVEKDVSSLTVDPTSGSNGKK